MPQPDPILSDQFPLRFRLQCIVALLSIAGATVLAFGSESHFVPTIAIVFSVLGFVFVDWLRVFSLPPAAAYAMMVVAATFCISDFFKVDGPGNHQMISVAQMLAFTQAILMLQRKTRRIFEQLLTFCFLELVVASVFNDAFSFGLLLIPIGIVSIDGLSTFAALFVVDPATKLKNSGDQRRKDVIKVSDSRGREQAVRNTGRLSRWNLLAIAPSAAAIAFCFFYFLPRTTEAARDTQGSVIGFDTQIRLSQIGRMNRNPQVAVRVALVDKETDNRYRVQGSIYMRAAALERYSIRNKGGKAIAQWGAASLSPDDEAFWLPLEMPSPEEKKSYDPVRAKVTAESSTSRALFTIMPFHGGGRVAKIAHSPARMTISHREKGERVFPRINYEFGTHGFHLGQQIQWTPWPSPDQIPSRRTPSDLEEELELKHETAEATRALEVYQRELLKFDEDIMPDVLALSNRLSKKPSGKRRGTYELARVLESFLATSPEYEYSLDAPSDFSPGTDPINHFVSLGKKGHCQHFSSALCMALRSQGIPSRIIVGYCTDEYQELSGRHIARGLHAHAWVEALISKDDIPQSVNLAGHIDAERYWLRLDPTPGARNRNSADANEISQFYDLAENAWDDYVVEMDAGRQAELLSVSGETGIHKSYVQLVEKLAAAANKVRTGEIDSTSISSSGFSSVAAVVFMIFGLLGIMFFKFRPAWRIRKRRRRQKLGRPAELAFYRETLDELAKMGIQRSPSQTPQELALEAQEQWNFPTLPSISEPLGRLNQWYYQLRFGPDEVAEVPDDFMNPEISRSLNELKSSINQISPSLQEHKPE